MKTVRRMIVLLGVAVPALTLRPFMASAATPLPGPRPLQEVTTPMPARPDAPPRKIVVGTSLYRMWGEYPGLEARLNRLAEFVDQMAAQARWKYNAGLDLAVLPEDAVTGETHDDPAAHSVPLEGKLLEIMGAAARRNHTYVIVPTNLAEDPSRGIYTNAAILLDRQGKVVGIYRKVHLVAGETSEKLEGGLTPGKSFPVFDCDFGKLGILICYDIEFDDGWDVLGRKGAEVVAWTSQSPQMLQPRWRAAQHGYYIVSSTWRNNVSVFDPIGDIIAQTREEPASILVTQIDLTYLIVGWQPKLENGKVLADKYGEAVGFRYSESEDRGIFWSNDPDRPIGQMVRELGLETLPVGLARNRQLQDKLRGGPPSMD
jgi:predicted amidohydrolase